MGDFDVVLEMLLLVDIYDGFCMSGLARAMMQECNARHTIPLYLSTHATIWCESFVWMRTTYNISLSAG